MAADKGIPSIPHQALLLICDGERALIARNLGHDFEVRLEVVQALRAPENPPTHLQGRDGPGRVMMAGGTRRSAVEAPDRHAMAEAAFIEEAAEAFGRLAGQDQQAPLALVAPPKALAAIVKRLGPLGTERQVTRIRKDLTKHPVEQMERILSLAAKA